MCIVTFAVWDVSHNYLIMDLFHVRASCDINNLRSHLDDLQRPVIDKVSHCADQNPFLLTLSSLLIPEALALCWSSQAQLERLL